MAFKEELAPYLVGAMALSVVAALAFWVNKEQGTDKQVGPADTDDHQGAPHGVRPLRWAPPSNLILLDSWYRVYLGFVFQSSRVYVQNVLIF